MKKAVLIPLLVTSLITGGNTEDITELSSPLHNLINGIYTLEDHHVASHKIGSAQELEGDILVVTIFADDYYTEWDFNDRTDIDTYRSIYDYTRIATDKITEWGKDYGKNVHFIWDWDQHEDLVYFAVMPTDMTTAVESSLSEKYSWDFIDRYINTDELLNKYDANGIVYNMYIDTPQDNTAVTCTRCWFMNMKKPYEVCYFFTRDIYYNLNPGVVAHEMLHAFGAPDLYCTDRITGITQEYNKWADSVYLDDIMFQINSGDYYYDKITNNVTDITAYYIGWTDYSKTVSDWGFNESEHIKYMR